MSALVRSLAAATVALTVAACPADPREKAKSHVVATVGDVQIREARLLAALAQRGTARIADPAERAVVARVVLDQMIDEELVIAAAQKAGVQVPDETVEREIRARGEDYPAGTFQRLLVAEQLTLQELREKVRRRLVEDAFLRAKLASLPAITDEEIQARYDATVAKVTLPEQVHARQILVRTSEEASHLLAEIRGRKISFEAAATQHSAAPDADQGGELGWFAKGEMPDVFDICFNLEAGTVSDVVESSFGFHIFHILDFKKPHVESLESARERISEDLARERQSEAAAKVLDELRKEAKVVIQDGEIAHVVQMLPPPPESPNLAPPEDGVARALDSHESAVDPIPQLQKEGRGRATED